MGCTQATGTTKAQIGVLMNTAVDENTLREQYFRMQQEMMKKQMAGDGQGTQPGKDLPVIVRQDWATLKQTLAPKNAIKLISCYEATRPLLAKACGHNQEFKKQLLWYIQIQAKTPKAKFGNVISADDEVEFCLKMAAEHLDFFRVKTNIADLSYHLAQKFEQILTENAKQLTGAANPDALRQISTALPLKWNEDWYSRFSYVMLRELASFKRVFKFIHQQAHAGVPDAKLSPNSPLASQNSPQFEAYYACAMVTIRFLEGISWGYSPMLMHERLDKETSMALKVCFNILLRLKQLYREDKIIGPVLQRDEDVASVYFPEPIFQRIYSHNQLDKLISLQSWEDLDESLGSAGSEHFQFLTNQLFRKTYVAAKKEIDEWLRAPSYIKQADHQKAQNLESQKAALDNDDSELVAQLQRPEMVSTSHRKRNTSFDAKAQHAASKIKNRIFDSDEISMSQLRFQKQVKTLTRDFLKRLKNPDLQLDGSAAPSKAARTSHMKFNEPSQDPLAFTRQTLDIRAKDEQESTASVSDGKPTFEIDFSKNFMILTGAATDTRVIVESFLQANLCMRSKYKCCTLHCCVRENRITLDSYLIVKNIIQSVVRTVPCLKSLLLLQHHDYFVEILSSKADLNKQLKLQHEAADILVTFCRVIKDVKLDFNVCVFLTGLENVFDMNDLANIVYVLRSLTCSALSMPPFLRFVMTMEKRASKATQFADVMRLLQTKKVYEVHDSKFFESEGSSLLDFACTFSHQMAAQKKPAAKESAGGDLQREESGNDVLRSERQKVTKLMLMQAGKCYRVLVDMLYKVSIQGLNLSVSKEAVSCLKEFQSDHIRAMPKIEHLLSVPEERSMIRSILQILTQICGPISFSMLCLICYLLTLSKEFIKEKHALQAQSQAQAQTSGQSKLQPAGKAITRNPALQKIFDKQQLTTMPEVGTIESQAESAVGTTPAGTTVKEEDPPSNASGETSFAQKQAATTPAEEEKKTIVLQDRTSPAKDPSALLEEEQNHGDTEIHDEYTQMPASPKPLPPQQQQQQEQAAGTPGHSSRAKDETDVLKFNLVLLKDSDKSEVPKMMKVKVFRVVQSLQDFIHLIWKEGPAPAQGSEPAGASATSGHQETAQSLFKANQSFKGDGTSFGARVSGAHADETLALKDMYQRLLVVPRKRKMLKACMSVLDVSTSRYLHTVIQAIALRAFGGQNSLSKDLRLPNMPGTPYEKIDPYLRQHIYFHWSKSAAKNRFTDFEGLLSAENLFKQIVYFGSYERVRANLRLLLKRRPVDEKEVKGITFLVNTLYLVQQTLKYEPINFLDFCTQLRGRILGDASAKNLPDVKFEELLKDQRDSDVCYFENFHHALRENPRIDLILQFAGCQILTLKFFSDKKRIIVSLSNGLLVLFNTETNQVLKILVLGSAVADKIKLLDDRYVICAGIDQRQRIWNMENQRQVSKFDGHGYCTTQLVIHKEFIISYGYDKALTKINFMSKQRANWVDAPAHMTNLKLLKTNERQNQIKLVASYADGDIILYDMDLNVLCHTNRAMQEPVIRIICLSLSECLVFYKDGQISVLSDSFLEETKSGSIFSLKSDDYIDMILIKSREYFLFTIEKQKIEFFNATTFKKSDSWDYFFERDIVGCDKNKEGSKICVWDKKAYLTLFNFLKHLDSSQKQFNTPQHRRYDPVVCIDVTERLGESNQVISCSLERDLRVWSRDSGLFLKKYDLSSFTAENVSTIKLGKTEGMLFLGSKDMNVYLIDVARGKLCVVYEGHWSRVTSIYTLPGKDILVTLSESNIKVWDLEYDECIKNMNDHSSLIVYCAISHYDEQLIVTISQNLEYKEWNYVTGEIAKQFTIDLGGVNTQAGPDGDGEADEEPGASANAKTGAAQPSSQGASDQSDASSDEEGNPQDDEDDEDLQQARLMYQIRNATQQERKPTNLVACHLSSSNIAYMAIDSNKIIVFNLSTKEVVSIFDSYQKQTVIYLTSIETERADYLIVVTRTSCVLYSLGEDGVRRMTSYLLNSRKTAYRGTEVNRYSYQVRFYFTSAKVILAADEGTSSAKTVGSSKGLLVGSDADAISEIIDPIQGFKTPEGQGASADNISQLDQQTAANQQKIAANIENYMSAIQSLSQSPLLEHNQLAETLQRNIMDSQLQRSGSVGAAPLNEAITSLQPTESQFDTMTTQVKTGVTTLMGKRGDYGAKLHKCLVYLGDSRGQVHMANLYLS